MALLTLALFIHLYLYFVLFIYCLLQDSRVDSGSVDLGTPLELSPKSPLEALDEALDAVRLLEEEKGHKVTTRQM